MELRKLKRLGILIALLCLLLFVLSNMHDAQVMLIIWRKELPLSLALLFAALIGFVVGVFVTWKIEHKPKHSAEPPDPS